MLSRIPDSGDGEEKSEEVSLDVNDRMLEVNTLASNNFDPRMYASCNPDFSEDLVKPALDLSEEIDIVKEQEQDEIIQELKQKLVNGKVTKTEQRQYMIVEGLLYFIFDVDSNPTLRLFIPQGLKSLVVRQFHDKLGHMSVDKTNDAMHLRYYFANMYKHLYDYIDKCITCQTRSAKQSKPPLQETDVSPYPFANIAFDI